ncbi:Hypp9470 [Branchiostoma lanceolatum]|uniref:Hypp9470 protein n=1 Tax=Branchiostoma lanceolatum TaxID=7740 RepID=A0A8S4MMD4_BRALA|nr:Hypp9470 [Branchiostoma lanceolatum]
MVVLEVSGEFVDLLTCAPSMTKPKSKKKSEKPKEASTPTESKVNVPTESPIGQTPPSAPPSGKVAPKSWFTAEIQLMIHYKCRGRKITGSAGETEIGRRRVGSGRCGVENPPLIMPAPAEMDHHRLLSPALVGIKAADVGTLTFTP